ncbi:hypothetical protein BXZ70DRAFT_1022606 [Cristinia sonorae]|uniref:C3H1-type domain-containing protein n=1 Tax=Cristinia sonorae TaxID=1940300 RepID=A0A8K0UPF5_9AGAR|nr:hypothetical protein BXZ70DRAFT_1022606 [Cristinia sonorae]
MLEPENATHLKPWLVKTLEPICDAEPGALADYILALLKHAAPEAELRKELATQLDEFLEKECSGFINTLFNVLRTKSYLPYTPPSPTTHAATSSSSIADGGIPIPLDALLTSSGPSSGHVRKRSFDDDHDLRPSKGPRLNADGQFSRYDRQDGRGQWQQRGERTSRMNIQGQADFMDGGMNGAMDGMNGRGPYRQQERRGICRDYHNNGYCARGAFCKYSHGEDAVIPAQLFPMNGAMAGGPMPFAPMMPNGNMGQFAMGGPSNAPYDPRERMDMRPAPGNAPPGIPGNMRPPIGPGGHQRRNGDPSHIQDLTPSEDRMHQDDRAGGDGYVPLQGMNGYAGGRSGDIEMGGPSIPPPMSDRGGGFRGRGGRGFGVRGTFGGDVQSFRPEQRTGTTLVVEKIPEDRLSLGSVNEWFSKFGTVTNVAVDAANAKALVSFSNHEEAHAAWKSEDAVFGNRFVKVFWHRPMEGHGQKGAKMLAASAPLVANLGANKDQPALAAQAASASSQSQKAPTAAVTALAAKQQLLEQQIAEQKSLMEKLSTASPAEKKIIMLRLRKLNEEMKAPSPITALVQKSSRGSTPKADDKEQKEKERLDKELEMLNATTPAESGDGEESTEELKAKLAKLKAEAASLGLDTAVESSYTSSSSAYRPYRGRGRGGSRGYYRGAMRGGPPRASMKLDNRPKKLLVKGADAEQIQAVRDWYETTGQVDTVDLTDSGDILVGFKSRTAAEQGLAKGSNIATVGAVQITWYTGHQHSLASTTPSSTPHADKSAPASSTSFGVVDNGSSATLDKHDDMHNGDLQQDEEEAVAGGWGGDADDGFGMM